MRDNGAYNVLLMIIASFFAAFTIGLNKYASHLSTNKPLDKLLIISEILVHGVSGLLIGLVCTKFVSDAYILSAISGVGGMAGQKLLYVLARNVIRNLSKIDVKEGFESIDKTEG